MMDTDTIVQVPKADYEQMQKRLDKLDALEEMGVDNWEGYDNAMQLVRERKGQR